MNDAGRIGFLIKGDYNASTEYDFLDVVYYNGSSYVAKTKTKGNAPESDNAYWHIFAQATNGVTGIKGSAETTYRTGQVNIDKGNIGLGNVENKSSEIIRGELTESNITDALNYTPLATNGDSKDNKVTFTSSDVADASATAWTSVSKLTSGEKHSSIFAKVSQMFKNIRYLYNNKIDLSKILTTVEACTASTDPNSIPNAAVISELNSGLLKKNTITTQTTGTGLLYTGLYSYDFVNIVIKTQNIFLNGIYTNPYDMIYARLVDSTGSPIVSKNIEFTTYSL